MKRINLLILVIVTTITSCSSKSVQLIISNSTHSERKDELVVLKRDFLEQKLGKIAKEKSLLVKNVEGKMMVLQFDDLNNDGIWDEAAFLYDFKPNDKVTFSISIGTQNKYLLKEAITKAHVRQRQKNADNSFGPAINIDSVPAGTPNTDFAKQPLPPYLTEGPAWESDKVAFRIYFDVRNTKDIYGKTTTAMMMDTVGTNPKVSYHNLSDWGMDILKVGQSLGAGGLALYMPLSNGKDTLVRLGGVNMGSIVYEKVADGPVRAIFRMKYNNWKVDNNLPPVQVTEEISIWGGQYFYNSNVTINNAPANAALVTGVVNILSHKANFIDSLNSQTLYTYDVQSENKDKLGMAVIVPKNDFIAFDSSKNAGTDIKNSYLVKQKIASGRTLNYRFYAAWEKSDSRFTTEEGFRQFMQNETVISNEPLKLSWTGK